ncbi:MAG: hypothetical protein VB140_00320 [Burkholderia sp.]|nr:MAG: hypothetical protein E5299_01058 [Burkholderia gladioli]
MRRHAFFQASASVQDRRRNPAKSVHLPIKKLKSIPVDTALRINDVTEAVGVSLTLPSPACWPTTVRYMTGIRQRVLEVSDRLDYQPNATRSRVRCGATAIIGLIVFDARNPFFTEANCTVAQNDAVYPRVI